MFAEGSDIVMIYIPWFEAVSEHKHRCRGNASNRQGAESADAIQRTHRIHRVFAWVTEDALPIVVQDKAMQIDRPVHWVKEHGVPSPISRPNDRLIAA